MHPNSAAAPGAERLALASASPLPGQSPHSRTEALIAIFTERFGIRARLM